MAGMVRQRGRSTSISGVNKTTKKGKGTTPGTGGGQSGGSPPQPATIAWSWTLTSANCIQLTFAQAVTWNGSLATGWRMKSTTTVLTVTTITVNSPTQITICFSGNINVATMQLTVPQSDPTFKGGQGQYITGGTVAVNKSSG